VLVAGHEQARGLGVLVVMNAEVHCAWQVQKMHTGLVSAFRSPNGGSIAQIQEDTVRFYGCSVIDRPVIDRSNTDVHQPIPNTPVAVITAALGDDGRIISNLSEMGFCGAVLEAMGGGSVPRAWIAPLELLAREMPIVYSSRTGAGATLLATYGGWGGELSLQKLGVLPAGLLTPLKARLLLQLLLGRGCDRAQIRTAFDMFNEPQTTSRRLFY
ncbi:MAG: asparaginase domain-containing protein, partial [Allobranchiibius sp.]